MCLPHNEITMKKRALVVDDSRTAALALAQMLDLLGFSVTIASGSREAVQKLLDGGVPDVVFLDVNMPGLSGLEVCSYIRREPATANVPIVVVSSESQPEQVASAMEAGATAFIPKPATMEALEETLRSINHSD